MKVVITHLMRFLAPRMRMGSDGDPRGEPIGGPDATRRILVGAVTQEAPHSTVRPLPAGAGFLLLDDLAIAGGPYELGAVLELVDASPYRSGWYPAEECSYDRLVPREPASGDRLWNASLSIAVETLEEAVGQRLEVSGGSVSLPNRAWKRTLGMLAGCSPPHVTVGERGFPTCTFQEPRLGVVRLAVTDVRFYRHMDGEIADHEVIGDVNQRLQRGVEFQIAIEVPPAFPPEHPRAGVTVGGIHLRDDPCWGMGRLAE